MYTGAVLVHDDPRATFPAATVRFHHWISETPEIWARTGGSSRDLTAWETNTYCPALFPRHRIAGLVAGIFNQSRSGRSSSDSYLANPTRESSVEPSTLSLGIVAPASDSARSRAKSNARSGPHAVRPVGALGRTGYSAPSRFRKVPSHTIRIDPRSRPDPDRPLPMDGVGGTGLEQRALRGPVVRRSYEWHDEHRAPCSGDPPGRDIAATMGFTHRVQAQPLSHSYSRSQRRRLRIRTLSQTRQPWRD